MLQIYVVNMFCAIKNTMYHAKLVDHGDPTLKGGQTTMSYGSTSSLVKSSNEQRGIVIRNRCDKMYKVR